MKRILKVQQKWQPFESQPNALSWDFFLVGHGPSALNLHSWAQQNMISMAASWKLCESFHFPMLQTCWKSNQAIQISMPGLSGSAGRPVESSLPRGQEPISGKEVPSSMSQVLYIFLQVLDSTSRIKNVILPVVTATWCYTEALCVYVYIYILYTHNKYYIYTCIYMYIYISCKVISHWRNTLILYNWKVPGLRSEETMVSVNSSLLKVSFPNTSQWPSH